MRSRPGGILTRVPSVTTDEELLRAWADRADERAIDELVKRLHPRARRLALRALGEGSADDAVSDALAALVRDARRFDGASELGPWWSTILVNSIRKHGRSRTRRARHEAAAAARRPTAIDATPPGFERGDLAVHLDRLPDDLRLPLVLHYYDGRSHAEVAAALGCPSGTASSRIRRGLEELHASLVSSRETAGAAFSIASLVALVELDARALGESAASPPSIASLARRARSAPRGPLVGKVVLALVAVLAVAGTAVVLTADPQRSSRGAADGVGSAPLAHRAAASVAKATEAPSASATKAATPTASPAASARRAGGASATIAPGQAGAAETAAVGSPRVTGVKGRLVDASGAPVAGARVAVSHHAYTGVGDTRFGILERARRAGAVPVERQVELFRAVASDGVQIVDLGTARSGSDGTFLVMISEPAKADERLLLSSAFEATRERVLIDNRDVLIEKAPLVDMGDIPMRECPTYTVTVSAKGEPVAGAGVYFSCGGGCGSEVLAFHVASDASGAARFLDPWGATAPMATVVADGFALTTVPFDGHSLRVELERPAVVRGVVRLAGDAPAAGISVEVTGGGIMGDMPLTVRTDAEGRFELAVLRAGETYAVRTGDAYPLVGDHAEVVAPAKDVVLRLVEPLPVFVTRTGEKWDHEPDVRLQTRLPDGTWGGECIRGRSSLSGEDPTEEPTFDRARPGTHRILVIEEGHSIYCSPPFELEPGEPAPRVEARLVKGRRLRFRVRDTRAEPISSVEVNVAVGRELVWLNTGPGDDGFFDLAELPAEDCELVVKALGAKPVRVKIGATQVVADDIVLEEEKK